MPRSPVCGRGRPGKGVFVRDEPHRTISPAAYQRPTPKGQPDSWVTEAARQGRAGATRILDVGEVRPPRDVAAALGTGEDATAVLRSRVMLLDGEPAELVHSYYPSDLALGTRLADRRRIPGGSPTLLASMGYPPLEFVDRVSVRPPTSEEFVLLELPAEDVCVLCVLRVVYSVDDRPIEVSVMVKAGHLYELEYRAPVRG